jgi:hypothetical protein
MDFNPQIADQILERIANGESLKSITAIEAFPSRSVVYEWLATEKPFADKYARAREDQADTYADEITAIADDPALPSDQKRIMVDARKWVACKLKPRKYGDKLDHTLASPDGGPVKHSITVEFV